MGHPSDAHACSVHGFEDWVTGLSDAKIVDEGEEVFFVDVVCGEDWAVGAEEREGRFEAAGGADAGDYYRLLEMLLVS